MESELPGDLIREILVRLPARLLLKLKSVCRSWNSLISSPEFALHHLQQSTPTQSPPLLCWNHGIKENENDNSENRLIWANYFRRNDDVITTDTVMQSRFFINYDCHSRYTLFDSLPIDGTKGIIRGSCNGLLCLSNSGFPLHTLTLFNPTIRSASPTVSIQCPHPRPRPYSSEDPNFPQENTLFWGFGYDVVHDKYKFVIDCCNSSPSSSSGAIVCTFGANPCCKTVDHPTFQYRIYGSDGIFFNGTLNWAACDDPITTVHVQHPITVITYKRRWFVLTFDLETESFGRLCMPEYCGGKPHLQVMNNSTLSVCFRYSGHQGNFYVWIMKKKKLEDGVEKDYYWTRLFKIPDHINPTRIAPLYYFSEYIYSAFFQDHVLLTLDEHRHQLLLFHIRIGAAIHRPELRPRMYLKSPASFYICHETLLSPSHYWPLTTNN
ncbi:hypothetical protein PIB30_076993 [Stylosanthes scabra]|uniref:F-box domain-containing protein n=1 Tax=Stylosanthes scabra TaxID=79078 RepID=A0ABU6TPY0_9FABA|nr:hypothetical protein [Stylosanthes scabra]